MFVKVEKKEKKQKFIVFLYFLIVGPRPLEVLQASGLTSKAAILAQVDPPWQTIFQTPSQMQMTRGGQSTSHSTRTAQIEIKRQI